MVSLSPIPAFADSDGLGATFSIQSGVYSDHYDIDIDGNTYSVYFSSPYFTLVEGSQNDYVEIAQRALLNIKANWGLNFESWSPVTNYFGSKSVKATVAFQQWWNDHVTYFYGTKISVDGKVGNQTWRRFETVCR